jgi:PhnB protein
LLLFLPLDVMFSDIPSWFQHTKETNVVLTLIFKYKEEEEEEQRIFTELSEDGKVNLPLQKTFWSELYGMITDKFSVIWHLSDQKCEST